MDIDWIKLLVWAAVAATVVGGVLVAPRFADAFREMIEDADPTRNRGDEREPR